VDHIHVNLSILMVLAHLLSVMDVLNSRINDVAEEMASLLLNMPAQLSPSILASDCPFELI
jgi:hypothetical protein